MKRLFQAAVVALMLAPSTGVSQDYDVGLKAVNNRDFPTAYRELKPLADQGHSGAQFNLGLMYRDGFGVPQDFAEAVIWFRLAADQGDASAQRNLGTAYENGYGVAQDYAEAVKWYRLAAEQENATAQGKLGDMYEKGISVAQDYAEAVKWYRLAAEQDDTWAQARLGDMYEKGIGVPQDYAEAVKWYRLAAEQGFPWAQTSLGVMYHLGLGVPQNYTEAAKWYLLAADQGEPRAQRFLAWNLGYLYLTAGFILLVTPVLGIFAAPIAVFFFQKKAFLGEKKQIKLDKHAYFQKILKVYGVMIVFAFSGHLASYFAIGSAVVGLSTSVAIIVIVPLICMGWLINYASKRLAHMGYSKIYVLVCMIPFLGHVFITFLAYTIREKALE